VYRGCTGRSISIAISKTLAGGEVVALDSGGYGTFSISFSITIVAPPGVYAGISATTGNAISISAEPTTPSCCAASH
jgi:hypothetical protein